MISISDFCILAIFQMLRELVSCGIFYYKYVICHCWNMLILISLFLFIIVIICCTLYIESRKRNQNKNLQSTIEGKKTARTTITILLFILLLISIVIQYSVLDGFINQDLNNSSEKDVQLVHDSANNCVSFDNVSSESINIYVNPQKNVTYRYVCRQNQRQQ